MFASAVLKIGLSGLLAELFQKNRAVKSWAVVLFLALGWLLYPVVDSGQLFNRSIWFFTWIKTPVIRVDVALRTGAAYGPFILSQIIVLGFALYYNMFFSLEKLRLRHGGLYALIFMLMMFAVSAGNSLQLLITICLIDVLSFYLISEASVRRNFVFFNFFADFLLLVFFALVWGSENDLHFPAMQKFLKYSAHREFAVALFLTAALIKCGCVGFHNYLLDLKKISFVRAVFLFYGGTPFLGLILLLRCYGIFSLFPWVEKVVAVAALLSILWAVVAACLIDSIKAKILYFNMMVWGGCLGILLSDKQLFLQLIPYITAVALLICCVLILPLVAAANEPFVSKTGGFVKSMKFSLVVSLSALSVLVYFVLGLQLENYKLYACLWLGAAGLVLLHYLAQVYFGSVKADDRVWAIVKNPNPMYFLFILAVGYGVVSSQKPLFSAQYLNLCVFALFVPILLGCCSAWRLMRGGDKVYQIESVQQAMPALKFFQILVVAPIRNFGRVLWLTVDFLFVERFLMAFVRRMIYSTLKVSRFLHHNLLVSGVVFTTIGLFVIVLVFYWQGVPVNE